MNILLIGHEGYLGRGLHAWLSRGHKVVGWDKKENLFSLTAKHLVQDKIELLINLSVMDDRKNTAFQVDSPADEVNAGGPRHIARILKGSGIPWIQMSTREVFGPLFGPDDVLKTEKGYRPKRLISETQPYTPQNCYGKSKVMAEFISESHPQSMVIRLTSCYTDFDHPGGTWVLSLIKSAVQKKPITLTQGGLQFRDPLHVEDLGRLMLAMHEKKAYGEKVHAGGGERNLISLLEFVRLADPNANIQHAPGGDYGIAFDDAKAKRLTGWEPQILVREKIPVIAENVRKGVTQPPLPAAR